MWLVVEVTMCSWHQYWSVIIHSYHVSVKLTMNLLNINRWCGLWWKLPCVTDSSIHSYHLSVKLTTNLLNINRCGLYDWSVIDTSVELVNECSMHDASDYSSLLHRSGPSDQPWLHGVHQHLGAGPPLPQSAQQGIGVTDLCFGFRQWSWLCGVWKWLPVTGFPRWTWVYTV